MKFPEIVRSDNANDKDCPGCPCFKQVPEASSSDKEVYEDHEKMIRKFPKTLGKRIECIAQIKKSSFALFKKSKFLKFLEQTDLFGEPFVQTSNIQEPFEALEKIVGLRIFHGWKEANEPVTQWKAIILDQLPTYPSLYLLKYDGIDCVYGLELQSDERILNLKILPNNVPFPQVTVTHLSNTIVGRAVKHTFTGTNGSKEDWNGMVLEEVPIMKIWFYITYKKDPVLYIYHLLDDYLEATSTSCQALRRSNVHIMPEYPPVEVTLELGRDSLAGKSVQYNKKDGTQEIGKIICQVPTKPSVYFIKFDNDIHIYVYNLVKNC
ncbi:Y-linked testis-specific protein 1-like [Microtus oregoni]|uniref:Y-linked testis-specific protein 1-like n=1 Tax=Microtus oregoni TaxID=111838 RepID=UPI001BB1A6C0|nr:Y-linked testis-specific protein 1-like [Microtus oregoni]